MTRISKGIDIPFKGSPSKSLSSKYSNTVSVVGPDFKGMKPTMLVKEGEAVKRGQPLFIDKRYEGVNYCSPISGFVKKIQRGQRRVLENLIVERSSAENDAFTYQGYKGPSLDSYHSDEVASLLKEAGLWVSFRTRPFSKVPNPERSPASIFITAMDSNPLAFDPELFIQDHQAAFLNGLKFIEKLKEVPVNVCVKNGYRFLVEETDKIKIHEFSGVHPSGNVGTHIHYIDPVSPSKEVWHIGYQDVVAIGYLFSRGEYFSERWVSVAGPGVKEPRVLKTIQGSDVLSLLDGELKSTNDNYRIISGSVLIGKKVDEIFPYLGRFHQSIIALEEDRERVFLGWHDAGFSRFSVMRTFLSKLTPGKKFNFGTSTHGSYRAMVPVGAYEKVFPFEILPTLLLKALYSGNTDEAQLLGCLELDEEDLALCTYVDPGKVDFGPLLRKSLDTIQREG
jgi:Na+-transporting NADH:ubiquinone oxidoreductase subunit A